MVCSIATEEILYLLQCRSGVNDRNIESKGVVSSAVEGINNVNNDNNNNNYKHNYIMNNNDGGLVEDNNTDNSDSDSNNNKTNIKI